MSLLRKTSTEGMKSNVELIGDLNDFSSSKEAIKTFDPDVLIHFAWQGIPDYSEKISKTNLQNSIHLFDFLLEETNCKKIIVSGSCFEYGKTQGVCTEKDFCNTHSFFSWAKHSLLRYLEVKCTIRKIDWIWFRIFYVYGSGQREQSLFPTLIRSLQKKEVPQIMTPFYRNDFIDASDVAEATWIAVEKKIPSGIYNLGWGKSNAVYDACTLAEKMILGTNTLTQQVKENGKKEQTVDFWADMSKTHQSLEWMPKITLEEGIQKHIHSIENSITKVS